MKQSSIEWLYERLERMIPKTSMYNIDKEDYFNQAKQMHKQELKSTYNHAMWALMDTGHGESFDEFYKNTYEKEN